MLELAQLVVVTHEGRPGGPRTSAEHWELVSRDSATGTFEVRPDGGPSRLVSLEFHPPSPPGDYRHDRGNGRTRDYPRDFEHVNVPAGRFRCGRTWRDYEEPDGRVMRVDEWWTPGIPVPVQSWTRWEGVVDTLADPPRHAKDVRVGTSWSVLERMRQP